MNTTERRRTTDLRPIQTAAGLLRASDLSALRYIVENARYAGVLGCLRREGDDAVLRRLERAGCLEGGLQ